MELFWFCTLTFMLTMYVVLDGFDLGAGAIHLFVARTDEERRLLLNAIGPLWDGNEVWIIAAGGVFFFAFPAAYASSFSGFYLPLMIVLWLLMLRGLGIEFRHRIQSTLWKSFWDAVFFLGSALLTIFFGAALGNVVRGVPLNADGYFFAPLWTTFTVVPEAGILDWFTVLMGFVALTTLVMHGGNFIAMKTTGSVGDRARTVAGRAWWGALVFSLAALGAVSRIRPEVWNNYAVHPWGFLFLLAAASGLAGVPLFHRRNADGPAFLSSAAFIAGMLGATAFGLYPDLLHASTDRAYSLTAYNTAAGEYGLATATMWFGIGLILALVYLSIVLHLHRGKVKPASADTGDLHY
jgi:cytochrome bd ubiquinol oxidase subunit II